MIPIRLGAVAYLNARPLVYGLDRQTDRFSIRFDAPSRCASLLHDGDIDLGTIPSIEYLHDPGYRIVPGVAIASEGPVASVALFSKKPVSAIRTLSLDSSSRTSVALLKVLCRERFDIDPAMVTAAPHLDAMVCRSDAALLIGDPALFADHQAMGLEKIDLGQEWTAMTGLPFVWAFWAGRAGRLSSADIQALQIARDAGVANPELVSAEYFPGDDTRAQIGAEYLKDNIRYSFGGREAAGLRQFYTAAARLGVVSGGGSVEFFE
jgi:chorismate dehydratase